MEMDSERGRIVEGQVKVETWRGRTGPLTACHNRILRGRLEAFVHDLQPSVILSGFQVHGSPKIVTGSDSVHWGQRRALQQ